MKAFNVDCFMFVNTGEVGFGSRFLTMVIGHFEHGENSFERIIRCSADVYRELIIPVGNSSNVSGSKKDVAGYLEF